jgi:predicted ATP-grasp superfamily ATP-dependent carboligase
LKLLVFEYANAIGLEDPATTVEGTHMLDGLLADLNHIGADYIISEDSKIKYPVNIAEGNCNPLVIDEELLPWLEENVTRFEACLPVAPEEDLILYEITKILEKNKVKTIGSSSEAVLACSDKFETYNILKDDLPIIETEKVFFSNLKDYKDIFSNGRDMLVKPADGVSCSGVRVVRSYADFIKASANLKRTTNLPYFLLQDRVKGKSTSVSILSTGEEAIPLSLNRQNIDFNEGKLVYNGGEVPYEHNLSDDAKDIAKRTVRSIKGLKGYVGVDLLLDDTNEEIYILEINPRLTTSYVALRRLLNFNLGEAIVKAIDGELPGEIELEGSLSFLKGEDITFK